LCRRFDSGSAHMVIPRNPSKTAILLGFLHFSRIQITFKYPRFRSFARRIARRFFTDPVNHPRRPLEVRRQVRIAEVVGHHDLGVVPQPGSHGHQRILLGKVGFA
jgi:hypothetical protein